MTEATTLDIFIRTYFRDLRWLEVCLLSLARFVEGYRQIVVAMPESSAERLRSQHIADPRRTTLVVCAEYSDDYVGQQITKLHADHYSDADIITHLDSDCVFEFPCDLSQLVLRNGRPIIRMQARSRRPASDGWRRCVTDLYGQPLPFDPLTPAPWTYSRRLYASLRRTCPQRSNTELAEWCRLRRCDMVSEFSLLAAEAWFHHRAEYQWIAIDSHPEWPCRQYWSRSPGADQVRAAVSQQLGRAAL